MDFKREIILILNNEFSNPSDEFVEFFSRQVHRETESFMPDIREEFKQIINEFLDQFLEERIRLSSTEPVCETEDWENYYFIDPFKRVRVGEKSHSPIYFNNDNKKLLCHLHVTPKQKYIRVFESESGEEIIISLDNMKEFLDIGNCY
jgi:hypothetical protein